VAAADADPIDELREHLQAAIEIELLVIPPYLTALYSLHPDTNSAAELIIRSVVVEEMLHLVLAANVLNAVGGHPRLPPPKYPLRLFDFTVSLLPFGDDAIDTFLKIEKPSYPIPEGSVAAAAPPQASLVRAARLGHDSIGAFYDAIVEALQKLVAERGEAAVFSGDRALQVGPEQYYGSGGAVRRVHGLDEARKAIEEIVEQGEGEALPPLDPEEKFDAEGDLAHYYRFYELRARRRFRPDDEPGNPTGPKIELDLESVYPMLRDPKAAELPAEVRPAAEEFNALWCRLLAVVEEALNGAPERMRDAVTMMFDLKYAAQALLRVPIGDDTNAGPPFEAVSGSPAGAPSPAASASPA
jgi:hypothetical protein